MRLKFFLTSLLVLVLTSFSISTLLLYYFRGERLDYIDDQIRQTATAMIDSELSDLRAFTYDKVDSIISEELGPDRVGKFFIIRDNEGKLLFESQAINVLDTDIPRTPQWVTIHKDNHLLRVVNLKLPRSKTRTLQVGIITEESYFHLANIDGETYLYIGATLLLFLGMTWILSASLFSPVKEVASYMKDATRALELNREIKPLPSELQHHLHGRLVREDDEFRSLLTSIATFTDRINAIRTFTRQWTFQMVHELKTPLTILNRDVEIIGKKYQVPTQEVEDVTDNLERVSRTITNFLNWAEVSHQGQAERLHVVKLRQAILHLIPNWTKLYGSRLILDGDSDFQVMCNPEHLDQFLNNLVVNSLKYSQGPVQLSLTSHTLTVKDQGPGIPETVLQKWGNPFNKGPNNKHIEGTGLGIAWVKAVAEIYHWDVNVRSSSTGTTIATSFPTLSDKSD